MTEADIKAMFKQQSFRATPQRIAVYKYLVEHQTHPVVEEIYIEIKKDNPNLSLTTIYNALDALEQEEFITSVHIDNERTHYDAKTKLHGHFKCNKCSRIFDFEIDKINTIGIENFDVLHKDVYYSGVCPECK